MTWKKAPKDYSARVLATQSASLAGYWPLNEAPGSTVGANLKVGANPTGSFGTNWSFVSGQGLDGNRNCLRATNVSAAEVVATIASFDGGTATMMAWLKMADWSGTAQYFSFGTFVDGNNYLNFLKTTTAYQINGVSRTTGQGSVSKTYTVPSDTGWICAVLSVTPTTSDLYINGIKQGTSGVRSAVFTGTTTTVRFGSTGATVVGYMADCAIWLGVNLTDAEIYNLGRRTLTTT